MPNKQSDNMVKDLITLAWKSKARAMNLPHDRFLEIPRFNIVSELFQKSNKEKHKKALVDLKIGEDPESQESMLKYLEQALPHLIEHDPLKLCNLLTDDSGHSTGQDIILDDIVAIYRTMLEEQGADGEEVIQKVFTNLNQISGTIQRKSNNFELRQRNPDLFMLFVSQQNPGGEFARLLIEIIKYILMVQAQELKNDHQAISILKDRLEQAYQNHCAKSGKNKNGNKSDEPAIEGAAVAPEADNLNVAPAAARPSIRPF